MLRFHLLLCTTAAAVNVLIAYTPDGDGQMLQVATAISDGVRAANASTRLLSAKEAKFERDVHWADAVVLGSFVNNGLPAPSLLSFIDTFDMSDETLSSKVAASFATGGSPAAGLQPVLESINRALLTFRMVLAGGHSWQNSEGTGIVTNGSLPVSHSDLELARGHGNRVAKLATLIIRGRSRSDACS